MATECRPIMTLKHRLPGLRLATRLCTVIVAFAGHTHLPFINIIKCEVV